MFKLLFQKYSEKSRRKKVKEFFRLMDPIKNDILLDAGARIGRGFTRVWDYFRRTIILDINEKAMEVVRREMKYPEVMVGDVCNLPLGDKSVDYVFSNAVIEHIAKERRYLFASEIKRVVRKGYFITTPNYYFPYELHYKIPFWQYLPERIKKRLKQHYEKIDLLSSKKLRQLFPKAKIEALRMTIWPETLICYWRK